MKDNFTSTEIRAGILVLTSFLMLVVFVAAIKGLRPRDKTAKTYYANFTNILGLNQGADVRFGGVRVGEVTAIEGDPDDRSKLRVTAEIAGDTPVNEASIATIEQVTLTAEMHLEISTGTQNAALLASGATLTSRTGGGGFMDIPNIEGITARIETLLDKVILLVGPNQAEEAASGDRVVDLTEITAALEKTLGESADMMGSVNSVIVENRQNIDEIVAKLSVLEKLAAELLSQVDAVVSENRQPLRDTIANLQTLTAETSSAVEELTASLSATIHHLEDTGSNANDLLEDERPVIEEILRNLQETTRNLRVLSQTLAYQPDALIRGVRPQGRKSEETR
jgi:phospholipid/cholesterol/gamma-HCH transport system substrate-binding protein